MAGVSARADWATLPITAADALVFLIEKAPDVEAVQTALKTIATVVGNAADPAKGVLKTTNAGLQKRILSLEGGVAALVSVGFVEDALAGTLTWDASLPAEAAPSRKAALDTALLLFDTIASVIGAVGDTNAPAQAREALKLCGTYVGNIGAQPDAPERRRINAANKALAGRLLSCKGGLQLLLACGFSPEPASGETEAYVCGLDWTMVRVAFATLEKAPAIWEGLAASRGGGGDAGGGGGGGGGGPKVTADAPSAALDNIRIAGLPSKAQIMACAETRDMQPALCKSDDGIHVLLLTYQCASASWMVQGSMEIPGGDFKWEVYAGPGKPCLAIQVDLGDAHGTGKPVLMRVPIEADGSVNEYTSSRDFIAEQEAEAYTNMKEPVLNMNWLEEIARKARAATEPVLATVVNLKAAMEAQH